MPTIPQLPPNTTPAGTVQIPLWNPSLNQTQQAPLTALLGSNLASIAGLTSTAGLLYTNGSGTYSVVASTRDVLAFSGTLTLNGQLANVFDITLGGNCVLLTSNLQDGQTYTVILIQDGAGNRTVTWPTGTKWVGGSQPTLSTAANSIDVATFLNRNGVLLGQLTKGYA